MRSAPGPHPGRASPRRDATARSRLRRGDQGAWSEPSRAPRSSPTATPALARRTRSLHSSLPATRPATTAARGTSGRATTRYPSRRSRPSTHGRSGNGLTTGPATSAASAAASVTGGASATGSASSGNHAASATSAGSTRRRCVTDESRRVVLHRHVLLGRLAFVGVRIEPRPEVPRDADGDPGLLEHLAFGCVDRMLLSVAEAGRCAPEAEPRCVGAPSEEDTAVVVEDECRSARLRVRPVDVTARGAGDRRRPGQGRAAGRAEARHARASTTSRNASTSRWPCAVQPGSFCAVSARMTSCGRGSSGAPIVNQ